MLRDNRVMHVAIIDFTAGRDPSENVIHEQTKYEGASNLMRSL